MVTFSENEGRFGLSLSIGTSYKKSGKLIAEGRAVSRKITKKQ